MKFIKRFNEEIYGNIATVYHRTSQSNLINAVYTDGFKPGGGDAYGRGFYSTYDIKSQEGDNMIENYGEILIKFAVPVENFFFFDYEELKKVRLFRELKQPTFEDYLEKQSDYYGIKGLSHDEMKILRQLYGGKKFTSDFARTFYDRTDIERKVKGIIFTGRYDGKVLLSYDPRIVLPLSFRIEGEKEFIKVERNREYLKQVLQRKTTSIINPFPKWFRDAEMSRQTARTEGGAVIWEDGAWIGGVWIDGIWKDGEWEDGIWKTGIWEKGRWYGGNWQGGIWKRGLWKNGIWDNGIWEDGTWLDGTWENGTWKNGNWKNGTWKDGNWQKGEWLDGTWKKGKWESGIWNNGVWENGVWNGGIWENGKWEGGIWKRGSWEKGYILDINQKGNFEPDWKWDWPYVMSPISPNEYWAGVDG